MAEQVLLPKLGNSVETCIILEWKIAEGESVVIGDVLCEAETDKATVDIESTAAGILLKQLYAADEEVPVLVPLAIVGEAGEDISGFMAESEAAGAEAPPAEVAAVPAPEPDVPVQPVVAAAEGAAVSPRARKLAEHAHIPLEGIAGTGPHGRVIERDVVARQKDALLYTSAAAAAGGGGAAVEGSGIGGRVTVGDLAGRASTEKSLHDNKPVEFPGVARDIPVRSIRKITAERMYQSISTTCQLTLHGSAEAVRLKALRSRLKASAPELGLNTISINDLILFAVARTILKFPYVNTHFLGTTIREFDHVHLGMAVDTERGLMVPVIPFADTLSLRELSEQARSLAAAAKDGRLKPEQMEGGTFTVTNLGAMGVEEFTPVLNTPQTSILGVGGISLKPVDGRDGSGVEFLPHISLSLTIDHQAVDGAPGARFLKGLSENIGNIDLLMMQ